MPRFIEKVTSYEARPFTGGPASTLDIQGWLLANEIPSEHFPAVGPEGEPGSTPERIVYNDGSPVEITAGQWLIQFPAGFAVLSASDLYTQYTATQ